ncbi:hypothetical protein HBH50_108110 [Parastagonospora nodorum]|nr:hypothetical protein HBH50_108110 [Parastagonospora nodorum]KAH4088119.1 hypothetical protein HBH48_125070 [Parastagonospora nodorum]
MAFQSGEYLFHGQTQSQHCEMIACIPAKKRSPKPGRAVVYPKNIDRLPDDDRTPSRGCSPPQAKTSVNGCGFEARVGSLRESTLLKAVIKADKETLTDAV